MHVGRLAALVLGDLMLGPPADDAGHRTGSSVDHQVVPGQQLLVDATDGRERDEPVLVDVGDDEADLVGVRRDDDLGAAGRPGLGPQVPSGSACTGQPSPRRLRTTRCTGASNPVGPGATQSSRKNVGSNGMTHLRSEPTDSIRGHLALREWDGEGTCGPDGSSADSL